MSGLILIDTREQDLHIAKQLEAYGIKYERKKLDFGDYSFVADGKSYERQIVIERKGSIDELIGNFTKGRDRFRREFERAKGCKVILMLEASTTQLEKRQYRSRMSPKSLKSFLQTWCNKFQLELQFVEKCHSCDFILKTFREYYKFTHGGKK